MSSIGQLSKIVSMACVLGLLGCNDSNFAGNTGIENPSQNDSDQLGNKNDVSDANGNEGFDQSTDLGRTVDGRDREPDSDHQGSDRGDGFPEFDDPDLTEDDTSVNFGANEIFHLGDGKFDASSCKLGIDSYNLSGVRYYFEFQVEKDNTEIDIRINKICGVDYPDTNYAVLQHNDIQVERLAFSTGITSARFSTTRVDAGYYRIEVHSKKGSAHDPSLFKNDIDDFIIGDVDLHASNRIHGGDFGAE